MDVTMPTAGATAWERESAATKAAMQVARQTSEITNEDALNFFSDDENGLPDQWMIS
jgi:hypothetical protein